ncbi:MAG: NAD(P)H-binding protein [Micromonospora sp.]
MTSTVLVTGGTGTLGRLVVPRLRDAGCHVRVLSRHRHEDRDGVGFMVGDLGTGEGIDGAVDGVDTIVHCAGTSKGDEDKARNLVRAASRAGAPHLVYISVVGADRLPVTSRLDRAMFGYFASKRAAELVVAESGLPWTTLRATQFHDLVLMVAEQMAKLPVIPVPAGVRFQPVDADDVAARMVELSLGRPAGLVPDLAGPRVYGMGELVRSYLRATGRRRLLLPLPLPGRAARALRAGANLAPERAVGRRTWEDFLAERVGSAR